MPDRGTVLGFDFGLARTGVAVGELESGLAHALETIACESNHARFARIAELIAHWQPVGLVVGVPGHDDGRPHELGKRCERFANQLHGRFGLPVSRVDERYSSAEAQTHLADASGRERKAGLDAAAAKIILQHYLDSPGT